METDMKRILFQGDSITDACRDREHLDNLGIGYPTLVKAELGFENPEKFDFQNRGISGNRIVDVYARIKLDIINLKPDYLSILIGVNDVWHELSRQNGVDAEKFEKIYCMMLDEIYGALPNIKIMILEPFVLEGSATCNTEEEPDKWNIFNTEVRKRAQKARSVAQKYNIPFISLQDKFDSVSEKTENSYWLADGVHPTAAGHELIKREWIKHFAEL